MDDLAWLALVLVSIGTFMLRCVPMLTMHRHLSKRENDDDEASLPEWLSAAGPIMIAATVGASLVPKTPNLGGWVAMTLAMLTTYGVWRYKGTLGLPIVMAVLVYALVFSWLG